MSGLTVEDLSVRYHGGAWAVRDVSLTVRPGELVALVGESGCGKSSIAKALLGGLPRRTVVTGRVMLGDTELIGASKAIWRTVRGFRLGYVSQDPFGAMDPLWTVRSNVAEAWRVKGTSPAVDQVVDRLQSVGIDRARERSAQHPHEWSGGMLQRAEIAASSAWTPELLVADEPTAALDVDLADTIIARVRAAAGSVLLISHDLALVGRHADRMLVMYGGHIVESGATADIVRAPRHPYTVGLLNAIPRPGRGLPVPLDGTPPDLAIVQRGCPFAPRCALRESSCDRLAPALIDGLACPVVSP